MGNYSFLLCTKEQFTHVHDTISNISQVQFRKKPLARIAMREGGTALLLVRLSTGINCPSSPQLASV